MQLKFENLTRPNLEPQVGDSFRLLIYTNSANAPVYSDGGKVGEAQSTRFAQGTTNAQGVLVLQGIMQTAQLGQWDQFFYTENGTGKDGQRLQFTVTPRTASQTPNAQTPIDTVDMVPTGDNPISSFIAGINFQTLLLMAVAGGAVWYFTQGKE